MKTIFKIFLTTAFAAVPACEEAGPTIGEQDAARIAEDALGGEAGEIERSTEGETDVWEVYVAMTNGATVEVEVDVDTGDVVVVEDKTGPFDYSDFTPTTGVLSYDVIKAIALDEVAGDIEAWEFNREVEDDVVAFEYEFYIRDAGALLWEIKFDAESGMATSLEEKDMVDP